MTSRMNIMRPSMLVAALLVMGAFITFGTQTAGAQCCNVNIRNATSCRFEACIVTDHGRRCVVIDPGGNNFDVAECPAYRFYAIDSCGTPHPFPNVPGASINLLTPGGCCVRIYLASECCWEVTYADACPPCY